MVNYRFKKLYAIPPHKIIKKIFTKVYKFVKNKIIKCIDLRRDTHLTKEKYIDFSYINIKDIDTLNIDKVASKYLCKMYLSHSFDLLGSGYVNVTYDMYCQGVEGNIYNGSLHINKFDIEGTWLEKILLKHHLNTARNIWKHIDREYIPIDWQMDFKSGFRYSQKEWYLDQPIGKAKGVDIKVPWELCRLQHLPQLAVFASIFQEKTEIILKEFRNQMLDFIMANPPRMGVVWRCTMDVSIRVSNMTFAFDLFKQLDEFNILDEFFIKLFNQSIYEHGKFITNNLEWYDGLSGNHYLSDICGLTFVSAYLKRDEETDSWLQFSVKEIISEVLKQFHEDGSNFEASTSYHRLSGELLVYTTALIYGILKTEKRKVLTEYKFNKVKRLLPLEKQKFDVSSDEFFPKEYIERIYRATLFTVNITKQNGNISQIGDNDSGRFFKFSPNAELLVKSDVIKKYVNLKGYKSVQGIYLDENILNHDTFISAANGFFEDDKLASRDRFHLEKSVIKSLCKDKELSAEPFYENINLYKGQLYNLKYSYKKEIQYSDYSSEVIDFNNIYLKSYPYFGLYIFRCNNFYLSVMAGQIVDNGNGGHSHNDKLSFELNIAGIDVYLDSGTYLYTPLPELRNKFRRSKAHNVPIIDDEEQCSFTGIFSMQNEVECEILSCSEKHLVLYLTYRNTKILREFKINADNLIIIDKCNKYFYEDFNICKTVSNGYGKLMKIHESNIKLCK
ncbi:MAG TPA: alginate lyase family protein [Clostridium sp.]|uniref:alginate lyase family protein n=1 Tax=Clostridium sp. TaxID=1506 RepID=UPI002F942139